VDLWSEGFATVSKIALEPEFEEEKSYVFRRIWTEVFRLALQSQMASMLIVHPDSWPKELASLGLNPVNGSGEGHEKVSRIDLKALFEGRKIHFAAWSELIAPISETIIRDQKLTITSSLAFKLRLATLMRRFLIWKHRRDEEWRELEQKETHEKAQAKAQ
jgi:hypothetical protein